MDSEAADLRIYAFLALVLLELCDVFLCALCLWRWRPAMKWVAAGLVVVLGVGVFCLGELASPDSAGQVSDAVGRILPWGTPSKGPPHSDASPMSPGAQPDR